MFLKHATLADTFSFHVYKSYIKNGTNSIPSITAIPQAGRLQAFLSEKERGERGLGGRVTHLKVSFLFQARESCREQGVVFLESHREDKGQ